MDTFLAILMVLLLGGLTAVEILILNSKRIKTWLKVVLSLIIVAVICYIWYLFIVILIIVAILTLFSGISGKGK